MGKPHASHPEHELMLKNYKKPYTCDGCKEQGFGSRYRCEECDFDLHKDCMFTSSTTCHYFFKKSTFKFFNKPPSKCSYENCRDCKRYCDACAKPINGFVYHCEEKGWDLHPCCLNLESKLHIDGVKFRLCDKVLSKCIWCDKRKLKDSVSGIRGWSYVSACENYHFHVNCATEMVLEKWKDGVNIDNNNCLALENLELRIQHRRNRNGGRGNKYWRIVKMFLKTIACILLGDPTITLTSLLVDLVA